MLQIRLFRPAPRRTQPSPGRRAGPASPSVNLSLPRIRFLFVGSRLCSTLPSDGPSRFRPCALLVLHLHQVAQGTCTPKLSDMSDTQDAAANAAAPAEPARSVLDRASTVLG